MTILGKDEIEEGCKESGWKFDGRAINRTFELKDFKEAMKFLNDMAELAEEVEHHPDMSINYNIVSVTVWTHEHNAITEKDFDLAKKINSLAPGTD